LGKSSLWWIIIKNKKKGKSFSVYLFFHNPCGPSAGVNQRHHFSLGAICSGEKMAVENNPRKVRMLQKMESSILLLVSLRIPRVLWELMAFEYFLLF